ncbi:MAG: hypothetical protein QXT46_04575 [Pyrobaculum sp.]
MYLAYIKGPPVAIFAGSWLCVKSPIDGTPIALGEPFGDCQSGVARLMSIATSVRMAKQTGVKVFVSAALGEDGVDAAFAGGADGVLEELKYSVGEYREGARYVVFEPHDLIDLANSIRRAAESGRKPFDIIAVGSLDVVLKLAPYVDGVVIKEGWVEVEVGEVGVLPEIGRCIHCGVDYLMYGGEVKRCIYCNRKLTRVLTNAKPPRSRPVFRSVYKKYVGVTHLRLKVF